MLPWTGKVPYHLQILESGHSHFGCYNFSNDALPHVTKAGVLAVVSYWCGALAKMVACPQMAGASNLWLNVNMTSKTWQAQATQRFKVAQVAA